MSRPHIINLTLEDLGQDAECLEFYIDELEEKNKKLRAEVERLSDELNTEKFRTCERCVEKTAARCVEIVNEKATYNDQCDRTIEAIRKEFEL